VKELDETKMAKQTQAVLCFLFRDQAWTTVNALHLAEQHADLKECSQMTPSPRHGTTDARLEQKKQRVEMRGKHNVTFSVLSMTRSRHWGRSTDGERGCSRGGDGEDQ